MEEDVDVRERLRRSNARFVASMNSILERYNHPFEDDLLVSMDTLTYDTPDGPKLWGKVSRKDIKKWKKKIFKHNGRSRKKTDKSKQQSSDSEDEHSTVYQESSENSAVDSSDIGEQSDIATVRRKFKDCHLQNPNVDDGHVLKKERVPVDIIVQDDERNIPKWITITSPCSSKSPRSTPLVQEPIGEQSDIVTVRRKFEFCHLQNSNVDDGQILKKERVRVDIIVQDDERNIPKWITITSPSSSKSPRSTPLVQEPIDSQAAVHRKKLELPNDCSSSKYLQLQRSDVPTSSNTITTPRHQPCPVLSKTLSDSIHGDYQSADEECSWSNTTLADLYPAMVEIFIKLMSKRSKRRVLKYMLGHLQSKRGRSRLPKLSVTGDNIKELGDCKLKKAFRSIPSCRSEDKRYPTFGNESRDFSCDSIFISNSSGLAPYAYTDTNATKMDYSDSSLEQHLASGKDQKVSENTAFPDVMARMEETFLVEDESQTTASPKNSEYIESEKMPYQRFSEYSFVTSPASSDSRAFQESKTQKSDFSCVGTSELYSSAYCSHGNSNNSIPITNYFPARTSNTIFIYPEKRISERQTSFQHKHSFPSWCMKQSPSKMPHKYEDAFEELYYKVCSEEFQKPLALTRPLVNSQNLEGKGRLVKSNSSDFMRSTKQCDIEFDRLYEQLCMESGPKFPGFQRASNLRKYEEIQMPETVNALVNSPVRTYSAISRVKRAGNFQNYLPFSPTKRLKLIPEHYFFPRKFQEISHRKKINPQTAGMDFLSSYNCNNPSFLADHRCHCQDSEFHDSSYKSFLGIRGSSLQESRTASAHSGWPGAMDNCSSPRKVRQCKKRVFRKLSYPDEKGNCRNLLDDSLVEDDQEAFMGCYT